MQQQNFFRIISCKGIDSQTVGCSENHSEAKINYKQKQIARNLIFVIILIVLLVIYFTEHITPWISDAFELK